MSKIKHLAFLNPHGNFDKNDSYLTEQPEFGAQLVYVKELAKALAQQGIKVDIITRQIKDPDCPEFNNLYGSYSDTDNLRILRLPFGGSKFLSSEKLWPHLKEYVDTMVEFYDEEGAFPDFFSCHYAIGGLAGLLLKEKMETPFSFTAHSLAAEKMSSLNFSKNNYQQLIDSFKFHSRLIAERLAFKYSNQIIINTSHERVEEYEHPYYQGAIDLNNEQKITLIKAGIKTEALTEEYFGDTFKIINEYFEQNPESETKKKVSWKVIAKKYLKAMEKALNLKIEIGPNETPAYYFLPDSENEHELLERFNKNVFKK